MSSLFNPGKRGILTLLSVVLIIGIPGIIAYADDSSDTYYSATPLEPVEKVDVCTSVFNSFGVTSVETDDGYTLILDSVAFDEETNLSDLTDIAFYRLILSSVSMEASPVKVEFASDVAATMVVLRINDGSDHNFSMTYDDSKDCWSVELDSVDVATIGTVVYAAFLVTPEDTSASVSQMDVSYAFYLKETVFTDDIVELIVLVGGIALLVIGTFSLSFIDLDTPGKAAKSLVRGAKSAGRKVANYGRKKR